MAHEIVEGYIWLVATLSDDAQLMSYAPGGVRRSVAPVGTPAPFVVVAFLSGFDWRTGNEVRIMSKPLFLVKAVGPDTMTAQVAEAAARIDDLLQPKQGGHSSGSTANAYIDACYRESPFTQDDPPVAGVVWTAVGGLYRLEIQLTN